MNIYVAGKTHDAARVKEVQECLISLGHTITYDWTPAVERHGADHEGAPLSRAQAERYAEEDIDGVREAQLVIVLPHERLVGTLIEIGTALSKGICVLFLGTPHQRCIFWAHPLVGRTFMEWPACAGELSLILKGRKAPAKVHTDGRNLKRLEV